jgi:hypothetical protein
MMPSRETGSRASRCARLGRWLKPWTLAALLSVSGLTARAANAISPAAAKASTSRESKEEAIAGIPFDKLKAEVRTKLAGVVEKPSIYRRLPDKTIHCDADMYLFLVRNPDVVVNIWELMGVTNVKLKRTGEYTFECSDGAGTVGMVELIYGTRDLHVLYAEATYEGPLSVRKLKGRGVMVLRADYKKDKAERPLVENRLDVFIQLDQVGAELVAKTLQSIVGKAADMNFHESATFVGRVSQAAESNGPGMQKLATRLKNCAAEVREQFADISALVSERAAQRLAAASPAERTLPDIVPPLAETPATKKTPSVRR